jgi:hypothetical protein
LRQEVIASGLVGEVPTTTLGRWLAEDAIKPWRHTANSAICRDCE